MHPVAIHVVVAPEKAGFLDSNGATLHERESFNETTTPYALTANLRSGKLASFFCCRNVFLAACRCVWVGGWRYGWGGESAAAATPPQSIVGSQRHSDEVRRRARQLQDQ